MTTDEAAAIAQLRARDLAGLESLVRLHQAAALRAALAITRDQQTAEDVVADSFLRAYEYIDRFDARRPFQPWFYRIVVNEALRAVMTKGATTSEQAAAWPDPAPTPEQSLATREEVREVQRALDELSPTLRATLALRFDLEMDERTIARVMECPLGTVKWRLHAARRRLKKLLAARAASAGEAVRPASGEPVNGQADGGVA